MAESADIKGRWVFARFWVFPRPNIMKRFLWTFWLDCRINGPFGHKETSCMNSSWVTSVIVIRISASSIIFKLRGLNFERPASSISYIFPLTVVLRLYSLRAQYISMSRASVICECSLNQFSTWLFVSSFVHREPQQIFMGVNTEYRANLVKARVNVPITLLHIPWAYQYKQFLIS